MAEPQTPPDEMMPGAPMTLNMSNLGFGLTPDRKMLVLNTSNAIAVAVLPLTAENVDGLIAALQAQRQDMIGGGIVLPPEGFKLS